MAHYGPSRNCCFHGWAQWNGGRERGREMERGRNMVGTVNDHSQGRNVRPHYLSSTFWKKCIQLFLHLRARRVAVGCGPPLPFFPSLLLLPGPRMLQHIPSFPSTRSFNFQHTNSFHKSRSFIFPYLSKFPFAVVPQSRAPNTSIGSLSGAT